MPEVGFGQGSLPSPQGTRRILMRGCHTRRVHVHAPAGHANHCAAEYAHVHPHRASTVPHTKLTQTEAARAAGVSRTSIWRAIKQGQISIERVDDGSMRIDASELLRLYPDADLERAHERAPGTVLNAHERGDGSDEQADHRALLLLVEELRADKLHLRAELERAAQERERAAEERARFLSAIEQKDRQLAEQAKQVRLLTDQRQPKRRWWARWW
jgi:hypothetical protein